MRRFPNGKTTKTALWLFAALLAGCLIAAVSSAGSSPVSRVLSYAFTPLGKAASAVSAFFDGIGGRLASTDEYVSEIEALKEENLSLKNDLVDYERTNKKLETYENFLGIKETHPDFTFCPASVIYRDSTDIYGSFTIDRGENDGVKLNDPVISGSALIGIVKETSPNSSVVYTIYHPSISVSAYEIHTREDGYTAATTVDTSKGLIRLEGLSHSTPVVVGGIVCTSGIGGLYPRDLIIGTVSYVSESGTDYSSFAALKPEADPLAITEVFVITSFDKSEENK